jgi:hypothetical protein
MDYLIASAVRGRRINFLNISYDLACQWIKHFWSRNAFLPKGVQLTLPEGCVDVCIPDYHIFPHNIMCHSRYGTNYRYGIGRTDGEGIERNWAVTNLLSSSTREMGAGSRIDTLDDHFGSLNWLKTVSMCECVGIAELDYG